MPLKIHEKDQILDMCFELFVKHGYSKTSTAMLAEAAGISKGLIFHHFKNKKKLYIAILDKCFSDMAPEIDDQIDLAGLDFFEAKEKNGLARVDYLRRRPKVSKLMFEAFYNTPEALTSEIQDFKIHLFKKFGAKEHEKELQMRRLFNQLPLREDLDQAEAYELVQVISEHFRKKLAKDTSDPSKMDDDVYWDLFFKKKNNFLRMIRYGIEKE